MPDAIVHLAVFGGWHWACMHPYCGAGSARATRVPHAAKFRARLHLFLRHPILLMRTSGYTIAIEQDDPPNDKETAPWL